jgi:hypothetical protein
MIFLSPLAFALLALIPPIIALYLLKLRRQDRVVSSTYLWQRFVRDVEANAPWQKLRRNLLLLLQILLLLLLILALARPATQAEGVAGQTLVLILDTSASMAATDGDLGGFQNLPSLNAPTRLDAAKAAARDLVANLPDDARVTILAAAGGEVGTLVSASQDRRQVLTALDSIQSAARNSNLVPALTLAEAIVAREPRAEIVLLSDGVVQLPAQLSASVRFISLGRSAANQAISALSVTPAASGTADLFVQVSNYGNQPAQRRLVIQIDGVSFTAFDLDLPPGGHVERVVAGLATTAQSVTATLAPTDSDMLPLDDRAWAALQSSHPALITLVTPGNFFLQTALNSLNTSQVGGRMELTIVTPADWGAGARPDQSLPSPNPSSAHLHIFDSYVPNPLPAGNLLFIAPPQSVPGLFEVLGQTTNPVPRPTSTEQPWLKDASMAETQILTTTVISASSWSRVVVEGETPTGEPVALLLAGEVAGRRVAILPFALQQSDLPLRPVFPILVAYLINYLAPSAGSLLPADLAPGDAPTLTLPTSVSQVRLVSPSGVETVSAAQAGQASLPPLTQPGLYQVAIEPGSSLAPALLAVNFFNPLESTIGPKPDLNLSGSAPIQAGVTPLPPAYREWWRPLALGVLILLVVEWLVYQRSAVLKRLPRITLRF